MVVKYRTSESFSNTWSISCLPSHYQLITARLPFSLPTAQFSFPLLLFSPSLALHQHPSRDLASAQLLAPTITSALQKPHTVDCPPISSRNPRILVFSFWIPAVALIQGLPRTSLSFKRFFHRNLILWRHKPFARKPVDSNTPYHINYLISD